MPVSMSLNEKTDLLLKAFHEGAVVIIDEINSSPMMERLLNSLLMGKTLDSQRSKNLGFMIIGTQNPVTMAGRRAPSTALQRRLITTELPQYNVEEMKAILQTKGIHESEVNAMVAAFEKNHSYAVANRLSPIPNFRDLLNVAELHLKTRSEVKNHELDIANKMEDSCGSTQFKMFRDTFKDQFKDDLSSHQNNIVATKR